MINLFISQNIVTQIDKVYVVNISTYYSTLVTITRSGSIIGKGYPTPQEGAVIPYKLTLELSETALNFEESLLGVGISISQEGSKSTNLIINRSTLSYRVVLSKDSTEPVYDYTLSCPNPSGNYILTMQKQNDPNAIIINLGSCTAGNYFLYSGKFDANYTSGTKVTITGSPIGGVSKTYNLTLQSGANVFVV